MERYYFLENIVFLSLTVAPLAGAWIETPGGEFTGTNAYGRSPCGSVD